MTEWAKSQRGVYDEHLATALTILRQEILRNDASEQ